MDPRLAMLMGGAQPQQPSVADMFRQTEQQAREFEMQKIMLPAMLKAQTTAPPAPEIPEDPAMRMNMEDQRHQREMAADMHQFHMKLGQEGRMKMMDMAQRGMLERMKLDKMPTGGAARGD